jgi:hypothetical protein
MVGNPGLMAEGRAAGTFVRSGAGAGVAAIAVDVFVDVERLGAEVMAVVVARG